MRFGAHCYLWTDHWRDEEIGLLERAKELGLDEFEIACGDDVQFTPALTRDRARSLGLELVLSPGGFWPLECDLSSDLPEEREKGLEWHKRQVDLAAEAGAECYAGGLYGHPGVVKTRRPPAGEQEWTADGLHRLAEHASASGVKIALEPMSHFRTHLVNTPQQAMSLIRKAGHDNLFVLVDTYHLVAEVRDYGEAIRAAAERLWGVHACENDRGVPGGGLVPWETVFRSLRQVRFDGYIAFESYNSTLDDFAFERGMFHNVCPDGDRFVREGITFVRRGLERASTGQGR